MRVHVKVGRKEGFVSSYNLFFEDGLRLKTDDLTFAGAVERERTKASFLTLVETLRAAGWTIEGEVL